MKLSPQQRREIYSAYQLGDTLLTLSIKFHIRESTVRQAIYNYENGLDQEYYWLNSPSQSYADQAKKTFITISEKYNTPSGRKRG